MDSENRSQKFLAFLQSVEGLDAPKSIDDIYFIELENVLIDFKETWWDWCRYWDFENKNPGYIWTV